MERLRTLSEGPGGSGAEPLAKRLKNASGAKSAAVDTTINGTELPADWPRPGTDIDLAVHDLPHETSSIEWWYFNGHLKAEDGREFSAYASFFKYVTGWDAEAGTYTHSFALTWALIDPAAKKYYACPVVDPKSPDSIRKELDSGDFKLDHRLRKAFYEVCDKGNVPLPDKFFRESSCPTDRLAVALDDNTFTKLDDGSYRVRCADADKGVAIDLTLTPVKPATRHGHDGVVKIGIKGDDMFYYFIPRNATAGSVTLAGETFPVTGNTWYDHEFGGTIRVDKTAAPPAVASPKAESGDDAPMVPATEPPAAAADGDVDGAEKKKTLDYAWNWLAVQLEDGTDITATTVVDTGGDSHVVLDNFAVIVGPAGEREEHNDEKVVLQPLNKWTSIRTTCVYPTHWRLSVPEAAIDLDIRAPFDQQEIITLISKPAFWEGRLDVTGTVAGRPVRGLAFVERHGFQDASTLESFFKRISKCVLGEIHEVLPLVATRESTMHLMADEHNTHYMDGADLEVFTDTIVRPLRDITDRGGKSWRSYGLMLCIDAVGGDSERYRHWLAMPELLHVGSLIVDDVQDESELRRGGPTAHKVYGEALAINAGTNAYFIGLAALLRKTPWLEDKVKLKVYDSYFLTLRAGHAGQAFDIRGLDHQMPECVESGDNRRLLSSVVCTHRLKSAVPAGNLARIGAMVGGGTDVQVKALGEYFESVGIAFQIVDDLLNLRGMKGKDRGEDLRVGKVTYPVAVAMAADRMSLPERRAMWAAIEAKPESQAVIDGLISQLEACGALDESLRHAEEMVEEAWRRVDGVVEDSYYKLNLRAFGYFVLQRHY